ncbi:MAG: PAS domain-containing protein, partial [Deltaproteobacteria bacterium]|nr:PAS domain-containing protein [Deltaproteobacteria bacterium]
MGQNSILSDFGRGDSVLTTVLNSPFDGIYVVDSERRIVFWNRGAEEITGYRSEEVMGHRCSEDILNHIDENGILLCRSSCPLVETLDTGKEVSAKVYSLHKDGQRFPVETHVTPIRNDRGDIVAAIEVFRDISQEEEFRILQERLAAELKEAEAYVHSLLPEKLQLGQIVTDYQFISSSQLGGDMLGYHWLDGKEGGRLAMYLLDVSGHGVGASLL